MGNGNTTVRAALAQGLHAEAWKRRFRLKWCAFQRNGGSSFAARLRRHPRMLRRGANSKVSMFLQVKEEKSQLGTVASMEKQASNDLGEQTLLNLEGAAAHSFVKTMEGLSSDYNKLLLLMKKSRVQ